MKNPATLCDNCYRLCRGYWYQKRPDLPQYAACSRECLERIFENAARNNGVINKTEMEKTAIADARWKLADALATLGLMAAFENLTPENIDFLIESVWDGCRGSMTRQSALGDIPF